MLKVSLNIPMYNNWSNSRQWFKCGKKCESCISDKRKSSSRTKKSRSWIGYNSHEMRKILDCTHEIRNGEQKMTWFWWFSPAQREKNPFFLVCQASEVNERPSKMWKLKSKKPICLTYLLPTYIHFDKLIINNEQNEECKRRELKKTQLLTFCLFAMSIFC